MSKFTTHSYHHDLFGKNPINLKNSLSKIIINLQQYQIVLQPP